MLDQWIARECADDGTTDSRNCFASTATNLVTKRAAAYQDATMEWVDGNLGSKVTMKYPAVWLTGEHAKGETLSIAFAGGPFAWSSSVAARPSQNWLERNAAFHTVGALRPPT